MNAEASISAISEPRRTSLGQPRHQQTQTQTVSQEPGTINFITCGLRVGLTGLQLMPVGYLSRKFSNVRAFLDLSGHCDVTAVYT